MRIYELEINDYQGIKHLHIKQPADTVILIGDNGSGKSTVLRALYHGLRCCFGYDQDMQPGIRLVLDLSDHFEEIKKKFSDSTFQNNIIRTIVNRFDSLNTLNRNIMNSNLSELLKNFIILHIDNFDGFIVEFTREETNLCGSTGEDKLEEDTLYGLIKDLIPKKGFYFWFGLFLHEWLKTRQSGNPNTPGMVFFDSEKSNVRGTVINPGNLQESSRNRIGLIPDQNWRAQTLGERLVSLVLTYVHRKNASPNSHLLDPIAQINDSLQTFTPHLKLISPTPTDNKLQFDVRGSKVSLENLSSGEISLINFAIDYLEVEINRGILIIDEPSVYLHYDLQRRLISFIEQLTTIEIEDNEYRPQIWIATHSPPIIHSVSEESIYIIDIGNKEEVAKSLKEIEGSKEKRQLLTLLGVSHYFDRRPVLFVEGPSDIDYLTLIFTKFKSNLLKTWQFHKVEGANTIEEMRNHLDELNTIAGKISDKNLILQLKPNHFLLDGDNKRKQSDEAATFIWNFYHLENLFFQDGWFKYLERIMQDRQNTDINVKKALNSAIEWTYKKLDPPLSESLEDLQKDKSWKTKLPGRDLFRKWRGECGVAHFHEKIAFKKLIKETTSIDDLPEESKRLIAWLEKKFELWLEPMKNQSR